MNIGPDRLKQMQPQQQILPPLPQMNNNKNMMSKQNLVPNPYFNGGF